MEVQIEELFDQADELMINQKKYEEAHQIFVKILNLDPENVDALNSQATCIKNLSNGQDYSQ